jgi:hypothetical protein
VPELQHDREADELSRAAFASSGLTVSNPATTRRPARTLRPGLLCLLALWAVIGLTLASSARAEVRSVSIADPADATPTVTGKPNDPDLSGVTISYDNVAGTISVTQTFYNAFSSLDTSQNYAFFTSVSLLPANTEWWVNGAVEEEQCGYEGFGGTITDYSYNGSKYRNAWSVSGYSGEAPFTTVANSPTQVTATAAGPSLVGHDWRCARVTLEANARSSASNLHSNYDGGCSCWAVNVNLDQVGVGRPEEIYPSPVIWFPGFPATRPKPESAEEKKAKERAQKAKEKRETLTESEAFNYMKTALRRRFGSSFSGAYPSQVHCRSVGQKEGRCTIAFSHGDLVDKYRVHRFGPYIDRYSYEGKGRIWLTLEANGKLEWNYAYRVKRVDHGCTLSKTVKACTKPYVIK